MWKIRMRRFNFGPGKSDSKYIARSTDGPQGRWIEVGPENVQTRLVLYPKSLKPNWEELKPSIVFECDDIQGTYEQLSSNGVKFLDEPKKMAWGTFVQFEDPDGNLFLLRG